MNEERIIPLFRVGKCSVDCRCYFYAGNEAAKALAVNQINARHERLFTGLD
jgi:hypothetical protein